MTMPSTWPLPIEHDLSFHSADEYDLIIYFSYSSSIKKGNRMVTFDMVEYTLIVMVCITIIVDCRPCQKDRLVSV